MEKLLSKENIKDILLSTIISVVISFILVFIFALFVKWLNLFSAGINIGNTIIKLASVFLGLWFGFKSIQKGLIKGACVGLLYSVLSSITFSLYAGESIFYTFDVVSTLFGIISGGISGIIVVNIRK